MSQSKNTLIERIEAYYTKAVLPEGEFHVHKYIKVLNARKYVSASIGVMKVNQPSSASFKAAYWRLLAFKEYLESQKQKP